MGSIWTKLNHVQVKNITTSEEKSPISCERYRIWGPAIGYRDIISCSIFVFVGSSIFVFVHKQISYNGYRAIYCSFSLNQYLFLNTSTRIIPSFKVKIAQLPTTNGDIRFSKLIYKIGYYILNSMSIINYFLSNTWH